MGWLAGAGWLLALFARLEQVAEQQDTMKADSLQPNTMCTWLDQVPRCVIQTQIDFFLYSASWATVNTKCVISSDTYLAVIACLIVENILIDSILTSLCFTLIDDRPQNPPPSCVFYSLCLVFSILTPTSCSQAAGWIGCHPLWSCCLW